MTPGPWAITTTQDGVPAAQYSRMTSEKQNGGFVSAICPGPDGEANARLIAAAPDLLEALQAMNVPDYPLADVPANRKWILAQRAIAKAEGRDQ